MTMQQWSRLLTDWQAWAAFALASLVLVWFALVSRRDLKTRLDRDPNPHKYEPILWAEPGSWWKVPLYRIEKLIFIDCLSPSGLFTGIMVWMMFDIVKDLTEKDKGTYICAYLVTIFFLASTTFALPQYRPQLVNAVLNVMNACADRIRYLFGKGPVNGTQPTPAATAAAAPAAPAAGTAK